MSLDSFITSPEWQKISTEISSRIEGIKDQAFSEAKDFAEFRYSVGFVDALRSILILPNYLFKTEELSPSPLDPPQTLRVANSNLPRRSEGLY
jgi:hypothetical protein